MNYESTAGRYGSCQYATLCKYTAGGKTAGQGQGLRALASATNTRTIVPSNSPPPGYNSVARCVPTCSGYADLAQAYPTGSHCGDGYISKMCQ